MPRKDREFRKAWRVAAPSCVEFLRDCSCCLKDSCSGPGLAETDVLRLELLEDANEDEVASKNDWVRDEERRLKLDRDEVAS